MKLYEGILDTMYTSCPFAYTSMKWMDAYIPYTLRNNSSYDII